MTAGWDHTAHGERRGGLVDVLEYWMPTIDWSRFTSGAISPRVWSAFKEIVQLSHAQIHWAKVAQQIRMAPPGPSPFGNETKYQRKKQHDEWKREIERVVKHMNRAAFLADRKIVEMSYMISNEDKGKPDYKLYIALRTVVLPSQGYVSAKWESFAFTSFNGENELDREPSEIAARWSQAS